MLIFSKRDQAWEVLPYPCIGSWHFLTPGILHQPRYTEIRDRLKQGQTLVDLGCAFAQDVRQLVCDGVPAENLYGVELDERFVDLGYSLFLDREKLRSSFLVADVLEEHSDLDRLDEKVDIVYASQFFHLFGWDNQVMIGKRMVRLLKPQSGSLIVGYQVGTVDARQLSPAPTPEGNMYAHNPSSLQKIWDVIGEATGTSWNVEATLDEAVEMMETYRRGWKDAKRLSFSIERTG